MFVPLKQTDYDGSGLVHCVVRSEKGSQKVMEVMVLPLHMYAACMAFPDAATDCLFTILMLYTTKNQNQLV